MKIILVSVVLLPMFSAMAQESEEPPVPKAIPKTADRRPAQVSSEPTREYDSPLETDEVIKFLNIIKTYSGKFKNGDLKTLKKNASDILNGSQKIRVDGIDCNKLNPLLDDGSRKHIMDCELKYTVDEKNIVDYSVKIEADGWFPGAVKITSLSKE